MIKHQVGKGQVDPRERAIRSLTSILVKAPSCRKLAAMPRLPTSFETSGDRRTHKINLFRVALAACLRKYAGDEP